MTGWIFLDGACLPEAEAVIPVTDRGFLFGDGAFTTIKVSDGAPEFYNEHMLQLRNHCLSLRIIPPFIDVRSVEELIRLNQATEGVWRLKIIVTGGSTKNLDLSERNSGHVVMLLQPFIVNPSVGEKLTLLPMGGSSLAHVKTLAYLERLWIKDRAKRQGFDDAVVTTPEGYVLETAFANLFWISNDTFYYPDPRLPYLSGVTLNNKIKQVSEQGRRVIPMHAKLADIPKDSLVFICNAMIDVRPVLQIMDKVFGTENN